MGEWALHSGDITLRVSNHNFISRSARKSDKSFLCCALMFTFVETHTTCLFRQSFVYQITFEMATNSRFESVSTDEVNAFLSLERNKNTVNKTNSDMIFMILYLKSKGETREINHIPPRDDSQDCHTCVNSEFAHNTRE